MPNEMPLHSGTPHSQFRIPHFHCFSLTTGFLDAVLAKIPESESDALSNRRRVHPFGDRHQRHRRGIAPAPLAGVRDALLQRRNPFPQPDGCHHDGRYSNTRWELASMTGGLRNVECVMRNGGSFTRYALRIEQTSEILSEDEAGAVDEAVNKTRSD